MKWKHLWFGLLSLLVVAGCVSSVVAVTALQNNSLFDNDLSHGATALTITVEEFSQTHGEKISLHNDFLKDNSSVTRTNQMEGNTALTPEGAKAAALTEIFKLSKLLPFGDLGDEEEFYTSAEKQLVNQSCVSYTYVDRDSPSRFAIFWAVSLEFEKGYLSVLLDDETGKAYDFTIGMYDDDRNANRPGYRKLKTTVDGFAEYLNLKLTYPVDLFERYHDYDGTSSAAVVFTDEQGLELPYMITLWGRSGMSISLPNRGEMGVDAIIAEAEADMEMS